MFKRTKLILFFSLYSLTAYTQGESWNWYFGHNAGINFPGGGTPVALTTGQCNTHEGSASISDAAGNLLFYTDGNTVWNRNHLVMTNGTGLLGHWSATQSAVIFQQPGSSTRYFIFTADELGQPNGIRYSEVDMTASGSLGAVTANKNIFLFASSTEKLLAVRHCNNKDLWIITHDMDSAVFRSFLVTSAGVNAVAVLSHTGITGYGYVAGQLKASPDGKKLAAAIYDPENRIELYDFDNSTGQVSNALLLPQQFANAGEGPYGCEFSPDGTKFYGAVISLGDIYQWNLCAGSNNAIKASTVKVATSFKWLGAMQLGPDGKIYVVRLDTTWLGVINNPNALGVACNYVDDGVSLNGKNGSLGLPNFVSYYTRPVLAPVTATVTCMNVSFTAPVIAANNCSSPTNVNVSYIWSFGDVASGVANTSTGVNPNHIFSADGTFSVSVILDYSCNSDTLYKSITVKQLAVNTISTNVKCNNGNDGFAQVMINSGTAPYSYSWSVGTATTTAVSGLSAGVYTITVSDSIFCISTSIITITQPSALSATITSTDTHCLGDSTGSGTLQLSGATYPYTYSWSNGYTNNIATDLAFGIYIVQVNDANNCSAMYGIAINTLPQPVAVFSINPNPVFVNKSVVFTDQSTDAIKWFWSFNDPQNSSSTNTNPTFIYSDTGSYKIQLIIENQYGCMDTSEQWVRVGWEKLFFIPNVFSPNGDGANDIFIPHLFDQDIELYELFIYNRWGNLVFSTFDVSVGWNGTVIGKEAVSSTGVYVWRINLQVRGRNSVYKGNVTLIM